MTATPFIPGRDGDNGPFQKVISEAQLSNGNEKFEFHLDVARGAYSNLKKVTKFGRNGDIASGTTEEVWSVSGNRTRLTTAVQLEAVSTDTDDTTAGTGAQVISMMGIDSNWDEVEEDIIMNGTGTTLPTTNSFFRVNRAFVKQTGTYGGNNEGTITIRAINGSTQGHIAQGKGQTEMAMYTLARNKVGYLNTLWFNSDASRAVAVELYRYTGIEDTSAPFVGAKRKLWGQTAISAGQHLHHQIEDKFTVDGPADIVWECTAAAGGAAAVEAGFDLIIIDD